jgi:hypothetical protein
MKFRSLPASFLSLALAAVLLAGCAKQDEQPARKAIDQIDAAIAAAGPNATKYLPGHVAAVKAATTQLKVQFYDQDFKAVVAAAPAILEHAQSLATAAAAKKAEIAQSLAGEWQGLTTSVPAALANVSGHVDTLLNSKTLPAGVNKTILESAKTGIAEQQALWDKATAAMAAGDIEQAVTLGAHIQRRAETLLAALGGSAG